MRNRCLWLVSLGTNEAVGADGRGALVDIRHIKHLHGISLCGIPTGLLLFAHYVTQILNASLLRFLGLLDHLSDDFIVFHLVFLLLCHLSQPSISHGRLVSPWYYVGCGLMGVSLLTLNDVHVGLIDYVGDLVRVVRRRRPRHVRRCRHSRLRAHLLRLLR